MFVLYEQVIYIDFSSFPITRDFDLLTGINPVCITRRNTVTYYVYPHLNTVQGQSILFFSNLVPYSPQKRRRVKRFVVYKLVEIYSVFDIIFGFC